MLKLTQEECRKLLDELHEITSRVFGTSTQSPRLYTTSEEKRILEIAELLKDCEIIVKD